MEQGQEGPPQRELIHEIHRDPDGVIVEGWLDPDTRKPARARLGYKNGITEEFTFDPSTSRSLSITCRDKDGTIYFFEDLAALERIQKSVERFDEKMAGLPSMLTSLSELASIEFDRRILEFFASPGERSH